MDIEFKSLNELYTRIEPALETKKCEMQRIGYSYIKEEDIWNYLKEVKWTKSKDLSLYEMIDDVLNTDNVLIDSYFKKKMTNLKREKNLEED